MFPFLSTSSGISRDSIFNSTANSDTLIVPKADINEAPVVPAGSLVLNILDDVLYFSDGSNWVSTGASGSMLAGEVTGPLLSNVVTNAVPTDTPDAIVRRDSSGDFSAGIITATLNGSASGFTGVLSGDVTGPQNATIVQTVGGVPASTIANAISTATPNDVPSTLVKRDSTGSFAANNIIADGLVYINGETINPTNILYVQKGIITAPNQFNTISSAIAAITSPSSSNTYCIIVNPGVYVENTLVLPTYTTISGVSSLSCIIQANTPNQNIIVGAPFASIDNLTLTGATGTGFAAISYTQVGLFSTSAIRFGSSDTFVQMHTANNGCFMTMFQTGILANAVFTNGFDVVISGSVVKSGLVTNAMLWRALGNSSLQSLFHVSGVGANLTCVLVEAETINPNPGTGFLIENGSTALVVAANLQNFAVALNVTNTGFTTIEISFSSFSCNNCVSDVIISNPLTTGNVMGLVSRIKSSINPNLTGFSLIFSDSGIDGGIDMLGPIYTGETLSTITNISPSINATDTGAIMTGGVLTDGGGLTVNIEAGTGYLEISTPIPNQLQFTSWNSTSLVLPANSDSWVFINQNGNPQSSLSLPDPILNIILGKVSTYTSSILFIQTTVRQMNQLGTELNQTFGDVFGALFGTGCIVTQNGTDQLNVSSGTYYFQYQIFNPSGGSPIGWYAYYMNGSGGQTVVSQNLVDYQNYDNGSGTLAPIPAGDYTKHELYVVGDGIYETYLLVYGQQTYTTLNAARDGPAPTQPPSWNENIAPIAYIIVQNMVGNEIAEIDDARPRIGFVPASVAGTTIHGNLLGLLADDHPQYILTNGGRVMTGNLNVGTNDIVNVGLVDGVDVPAHASRHLPNGADPLVYATPVTISTLNQVGIQNSFALSDHVHNHGQQTDPTLHAVATDIANGFLSATDKATIDAATSSNTPNTLVERDSSGNFSANVITATLNGSASGFSGTLSGDVTGTQNATVVAFVGGVSAANIAAGATEALAATPADTPSTIVLRDGSGDFSANVITATLNGNASGFTGSLSGDVTGTQNATVVSFVDGVSATNIASGATAANNASSTNTSNTIVLRDGSGNFAAGTITATLVGNSSGFTGSLAGEVTGTQTTTTVTNAVSTNTADAIVRRDSSGNFVAGVITATLNGNSSGFTGNLAGEVTGTQSATVVSNAVSTNTPSAIVRRDSSGNFVAGVITATLNGSATNFSGNLAGEVTGTQTSTVVTNAVSTDTPSAIVRRDSSGNFSAGTITLSELISSSNTGTNIILGNGTVTFNIASANKLEILATGDTQISQNAIILGDNALKLNNTANTQSVNLIAPSTLASTYTLTFPTTVGTTGQILQNTGAGVTTWANPSLVSQSIELVTSATTSSTTFILITSMSVTPTVVGTYYIVFEGAVNATGSTNEFSVAIYNNGVQSTNSVRNYRTGANAEIMSAVTSDIFEWTTGAIQVRWLVGNAGTTGTITGRSLRAFLIGT